VHYRCLDGGRRSGFAVAAYRTSGRAALASIDFVALFWLPRFCTAPHYLGVHVRVYIGVFGGMGAGLAILGGILEVLAAWLLGLMFLVFNLTILPTYVFADPRAAHDKLNIRAATFFPARTIARIEVSGFVQGRIQNNTQYAGVSPIFFTSAQ
jgi:hypothetical protein